MQLSARFEWTWNVCCSVVGQLCWHMRLKTTALLMLALSGMCDTSQLPPGRSVVSVTILVVQIELSDIKQQDIALLVHRQLHSPLS